MLTTRRMRLIPATLDLARVELTDRAAFARLLDAEVPDNWPPDMLADALPWFLKQLEANPELSGWLGWYGVVRGDADNPSALAASGGFMGRPRDGSVEVGYSVLPQFQQQGLGSEMVASLVAWAFTHDEVTCVFAEIHATNTPSQRLVRSLGFVQSGPGKEPDTDRFELVRA